MTKYANFVKLSTIFALRIFFGRWGDNNNDIHKVNYSFFTNSHQ